MGKLGSIGKVKKGYYIPKVKVGKFSNKKGKYIVYNSDTIKNLSGISGQSRTKAYQIAKDIKKTGIPKEPKGKYSW